MTRLNQIIAIEKQVKVDNNNVFTAAYHSIQKPDLFTGLTRTYAPLADDGVQLPPESKNVVSSVPLLVTQVQSALERLFDMVLTKDSANQEAVGHIAFGDSVIEDVPVSTLLWLEKQLVDLGTFVSKLPVNDVADEWTWDNDAQVWRSEPAKTVRSKKVPRVLVAYEATDKHPAQLRDWTEDVPEGMWTTQKLSGAISVQQRAKMAARVKEIQLAVKQAREEANMLTVTDRHMGNVLLNYVFGG